MWMNERYDKADMIRFTLRPFFSHDSCITDKNSAYVNKMARHSWATWRCARHLGRSYSVGLPIILEWIVCICVRCVYSCAVFLQPFCPSSQLMNRFWLSACCLGFMTVASLFWSQYSQWTLLVGRAGHQRWELCIHWIVFPWCLVHLWQVSPRGPSDLSDERFGAKLRVTENRCVVFDFSTYVYFALLPQHWALYAKVHRSSICMYKNIYKYIFSCTATISRSAGSAKLICHKIQLCFFFLY